jgi:hypothetical protein
MKLLLAFSIAAVAGVLAASAANAACERSCTEVAETCVNMGASRAACFADMGNCKKTGSLHMPSGRTFSNLCRK